MRQLMSMATLVTPNLDEARALTGISVHDLDSMRAAAAKLLECGCAGVLLKGGHLDGPPCDVLMDGTRTWAWRHDRVEANTHGTGCMLASAIAARLGLGDPLQDACATALAFVHDALVRGAPGLADVESAIANPSHLVAHVTPTS